LRTTGSGIEVSDPGIERTPQKVRITSQKHPHPDYGNSNPGLSKGAKDKFPLAWVFAPFFPIG
jgi:hypothetical protein